MTMLGSFVGAKVSTRFLSIIAALLLLVIMCSCGGGGTEIVVEEPDVTIERPAATIRIPAYRGTPQVRHKSANKYLDGTLQSMKGRPEFSDSVEVLMELCVAIVPDASAPGGFRGLYEWLPVTNSTADMLTATGSVSVPVIQDLSSLLGDTSLAWNSDTYQFDWDNRRFDNGTYRRETTVGINEDALTYYVCDEILGLDMSSQDIIVNVNVSVNVDVQQNNNGFIEGLFGGLAGGGIVAAMLSTACPEGSSGYDVGIDNGTQTTPPPVQAILNWTVPAEATPSSNFSVAIVSTCPKGWVLKHGSITLASGQGNKTVQVTMVGTGSMTLTLTDGCGNSLTATVNPKLKVLYPPIVELTANPPSGVAPLFVTFTAIASDPDGGAIQSYQWDFNGDGTYDQNTGTSPTATTTYTTVGVRTVVVRVTDDELQSATDSTTATVTAPTQQVTYTLFVAGTKGSLEEGEMWSVDETGSQIVNIFEWRGSDGSKVSISSASVQVLSELPVWCYYENGSYTTELKTAFWSQPNDPDVEDVGNMFVEPGIYDITFQVPAHASGADNTRFFRLEVLDRPDFP